jgi:hypothetical protein
VPVAIALISGAKQLRAALGQHHGRLGDRHRAAHHLVLIFQRRIVSGLTAGAVKG